MPVLKFNNPPKEPQNLAPKPVNYDAHGPNVALRSSLVGEPMFHPYDMPNVEPAGRYLGYAPTAEQKIEQAERSKNKGSNRSAKRERRCRGEDDTCMGWARHDTGYCYGHSVQLGLKQGRQPESKEA